MGAWKNMPAAGLCVVVVIAALFLLSLGLLFMTYGRYRRLSGMVSGELDRDNEFLRYTVNEFAAAYRQYGEGVNTPAIIANAIHAKMGALLLFERFLNNAVSLFVTLGLFGTFLGLSLSVSSLTELISYSNTSEWLSVLDSVGGGLMSALSGMGVAFYTSLVGVGCSIVLTLLRSIFSPQSEREKLETELELWLDHTVAPTLPTEGGSDDASLVRRMVAAIHGASDAMETSLRQATAELSATLEGEKEQLAGFNKTVASFNEGVRDFSEFNYNLRGTVERMDVSIRDLVGAMRESRRSMERKDGQ